MSEIEDGQWIDRLSAQLVDAERPAEVLRVAGAWLAARMAAEGFAWLRSRGTLQRVEGDRMEQIHLQNSRSNRAGEQVMFNVVLNVRDRRLAAWRGAHPDSALREGSDDWVCGHPLGSLVDSMFGGHLGLTHPVQRLERMEAFVGRLRQVAMPWFDSTADPSRLVTDVPDLTLGFDTSDLLEWLISRDEQGQARALLERWMALYPSNPADFEAGCELARRDGERPPPGCGEAPGWTAVRLGLL
ncbi:hypothetical protein ACGFNU_44085 [Spirillospora sp. NPDC048911]|uniref:hypothetical protein n=1 Tax=Spirillospora sp. NPDC048911 TaxID=3364527 RepID=UPI003712923D